MQDKRTGKGSINLLRRIDPWKRGPQESGAKGGAVRFDRAAEARLSVAVREILRQKDAPAE